MYIILSDLNWIVILRRHRFTVSINGFGNRVGLIDHVVTKVHVRLYVLMRKYIWPQDYKS